jgi:hypothetical protein
MSKPMTTQEIWMLEKDQRMDAFIERYLDLDEMTGNRTLVEKMEMLEIATAIMPTLIKEHRADKDYLCLKHSAGAMVEDVDCIACYEKDLVQGIAAEFESINEETDQELAEQTKLVQSSRAEAFAEAVQIAYAIRRTRCGCPHCESTATEIASVIQGNQLAAELRAEDATKPKAE